MKYSDVKRLLNYSSKEEKTNILLKIDKIDFLGYLYKHYEINKELIMFIFTFLSNTEIIQILNDIITNRNTLLFCVSHEKLLKLKILKPKNTYIIKGFDTLNDVSIQNTKCVYYCESCLIIITKHQNMNIIHFLSDCNRNFIKSVLNVCNKKIVYYTNSEFIKSMFEYVFDYRFLIFTHDFYYNYLIRDLNNMFNLNIIKKNNYDDIEKIELRIQRRIPALMVFRDLNFNNHMSRVFNNLHLKIVIVKFL